MPLYLDVPVYSQSTPYECWWACMRMIFAYYGHFYLLPDQISSRFDLSLSPFQAHQSRSPLPPDDATIVSSPALWRTFGVPPVDEAMQTLSQLTGFRRIAERPVAWNPETLEQLLRQHGPLMFYGRRQGAFHAFVLTGADGVQACMHDPDGGEPFRESIENFNRRLVSIGVDRSGRINFHSYNPMYLPSTPPVQETLQDPLGSLR